MPVIRDLSAVPGIISSRTLILTSEYGNRKTPVGSNFGVLLVDSMNGNERKSAQNISEIPEAYTIYGVKGIYDVAALVSFEDEEELQQKVNSIPHLRSASLFTTADVIDPVEVETNPQPISTKHFNTRNKYEGTNYEHDTAVNESFADGCIAMANALLEIEGRSGPITTVYAPLRGAKPMVDAMMEAYRRLQTGDVDFFSPRIRYPVTSSFVSYPECHPYLTTRGRSPASGRATNKLELQRFLERAEDISRLLYVDEIVSGGMLMGHTREMVRDSSDEDGKGILVDQVTAGDVNIDVFGLAHAFGTTFGKNKERIIQEFVTNGKISFRAFPVKDLVTEDQRFLLGNHYLLNSFGPHTVPFITGDREFTYEYKEFWRDLHRKIVSL